MYIIRVKLIFAHPSECTAWWPLGKHKLIHHRNSKISWLKGSSSKDHQISLGIPTAGRGMDIDYYFLE